MCLCLCLATSSAFSWTYRPLRFAVSVLFECCARSTKARGRFLRLTAFIFSLTSLVGPSGLEPPTSCLSGTRSNLLSYEPMWLVSDFSSLGWWRWWDSILVRTTHSVFLGHKRPPEVCSVPIPLRILLFWVTFITPYTLLGGDDGIRTHDPLLAGQVLSQLSYTPI